MLARSVGIYLLSLGLIPLVLGCASTQNGTKDAKQRGPSSAFDFDPVFNEKLERFIPNESEAIQGVIKGMLAIQRASATSDGKLHRGTHAKGTCLGGTLEIFDLNSTIEDRALAARLQKGMFSRAGSYPSVVRFANASGTIEDDHKPDVRAVSLAVSTPTDISNPQGRMDFALNNASTFPIKDAQVFADVMILAQKKIEIEKAKKAGDWAKICQILNIPFRPEAIPGILKRMSDVKQAIVVGEFQKNQELRPYQKMAYWSNVPFQLGEDEAVKYVLTPCEDNKAQAIGTGRNAVSDELMRHVNNDSKMSCWDFQVQPFEKNMVDDFGQTHPVADWVENALVEWKSPAHTVGRLTLTAKSGIDPATCESRKIDVTTNNSPTHRGLGSINRARMAAESASAAKRGAQ